MKTSAIVLAAGRGTRMGSKIPKQYLELCDRPILYYALHVFEESSVDEIILVTSEEEISYCRKEIVEKYGFKKVVQIVCGGKERYHSVYQGLQSIKNSDYVFIHDGARPFVTKQEISELMVQVQTYGACICAVPVKDTIKISDANGFVVETPARDALWQIQTPQVFSFPLIVSAYQRFIQKMDSTVTDDAMIVERYANHPVKLIMSSYRNIKITTQEDLIYGKLLMGEGKS
ncbi:MAG: 2-C-methyl-D-erythritol 4-phosphate cytidylyltransferase [Clostridiales bacterium]|nr:2-C-methyl-D-erythritol 4-phosphate cytidylyltransferase [Clostridiales bacterium]